jgi:hypothetical protein
MKKPIQIKDAPDYREALVRLDRLKPQLEQASRHLEILTYRVSRTKIVKHYLARQVRVMPGDEREFDHIALEVAAAGDIPDGLLDRLRKEAPPVPITDSDQASLTEEVNDAIRSVELFKRAIALQEREILRHKNLAVAEVCNAVRGERERIARKIAGAAIDLAAAVAEENILVESLRAQDEAIVAALRPQPFPIALNSDSAVCHWVALALGISEAAVQARMENSADTQTKKAAIQ